MTQRGNPYCSLCFLCYPPLIGGVGFGTENSKSNITHLGAVSDSYCADRKHRKQKAQKEGSQ